MSVTVYWVFCWSIAVTLIEVTEAASNTSTTPTPTKAPPAISCASGWFPGKNECFLVVPLESNWIKSFSYCLAMEGSLVDINSKDDQDDLTSVLTSKYPDISGKKLWIGGTDLSTEGQWQWSTFGQNASYTNWVGKKDPLVGKGLDCMLLIGGSYKMEAANCDSRHPFICQSVPL